MISATSGTGKYLPDETITFGKKESVHRHPPVTDAPLRPGTRHLDKAKYKMPVASFDFKERFDEETGETEDIKL